MTTETKKKISLEAIDDIIHKHNQDPGAVMPILHEIQNTYGFVPPAAIERIAENTGIPASELFGVATFYARFRLQPLGKNQINVCHGTACHLNGIERISQAIEQAVGAKEGETSKDRLFTVERVACFGCCSLAPCLMVNDKIHGRLTPESARKLLSQMKTQEAKAATERPGENG